MYRKTVIVLLVTLFVTSFSYPSYANDDVNGWQNFTWGMTAKEIIRKTDGKAKWSNDKEGTDDDDMLYIERIESISGLKLEVRFFVHPKTKKLNAVVLGQSGGVKSLNDPKPNWIRVYKEMYEALISKYGAPTHEFMYGDAVWSFKNTVIKYRVRRDDSGKILYVAVIYLPGEEVRNLKL